MEAVIKTAVTIISTRMLEPLQEGGGGWQAQAAFFMPFSLLVKGPAARDDLDEKSFLGGISVPYP
jgi:hypothetical protein